MKGGLGMKKMRLIKIYAGICAVCMALFNLTCCTEDDFAKSSNVEEGVPIKVSLNFAAIPSTDVAITRASGSDLSELSDVVICVFHGDGSFEQMVTNYGGGGLTVGETPVISATGQCRYSVSFKSTSGEKKLIAVANVAGGAFWKNMITDLTTAYNEKKHFDDVKAIVAEVSHNLVEQAGTTDGMQPFHITSSSQMLISGWNDGVVFGTNNTVTNYGNYGYETNQVAIKMKRAMAHITFNIAANLSATDGANGTFTPTSFRVYNIPTKSYLTNGISESLLTTGVTDVRYVNTALENIGTAQGGNYSFDFYMPENVQEQKKVGVYNNRDAWEGASGTSAEKKEWKYAPQNSTFVVISGTYEGDATIDHSQKPVTANVEYTIHLGDFGETSETNRNYGDFSVMRNYSYTYNVKVLGVDNIVVEAKKEGGDQQGAEGSVYDQGSTKYSYNLDAHYEQVFLEYNLSAIANSLKEGLSDQALDDAIANQLILIIQSEAMDYTHESTTDEPYTTRNKRGTLSPYKIYADAVRTGTEYDAVKAKANVLDGAGSGIKPEKGFDYKWIEFLPQEGTDISAYPGISSWAMEDLRDVKNDQFYAGAKGESNVNGDPTKLIDVYDMIVEMGKAIKQIYNKGNKGGTPSSNKITISSSKGSYVARFTAFVNEYYYLHHPLTGMKATSWSVMTNKIPREMIIAMSTETSSDGNSSYSKIHSYISQLAMETFYNDRVSSLNAFGIETYNETPLDLPFGRPFSETGLTDNDGRTNQKILIGASSSPKWSSYITPSYNGWMGTVGTDRTKHKLDARTYVKDAYAACMSRNRDLNGNGVIDENEIRWFLPSVNEYIRIGIGANALSNFAKLYMGDKSAMKADRYATAYISDGALYFTSSGANKRVFWAVEKGAYSVDGVDYVGYSKGKPIRCIRVLPSAAENSKTDISSINEVISDATYIVHEATSNLPKTLEFKDRLVSSLYRQRASSTLAIHNEDNDANSFYEGIFVAEDYLKNRRSNSYYYYDFGELLGIGRISLYNPCAKYNENGFTNWRLPNLVELSAMNAAGWLDDCLADGASTPNKNVASCTQFSNQNVRLGFVRTNGIGCYGTGDTQKQIRVRCVRDVPENYVFPTN